jgi:hypothetical protein
VEKCGPCPVFPSFNLAFALQLRKKHGKTCQGKKNLSQVKKNLIQSTVYILPKHPHITKPSQTHTLQNPHIHKHTHITKQYKTTTVQIKTKCTLVTEMYTGEDKEERRTEGRIKGTA